MQNGAIWILGATGRIGRAVATRLVAQGKRPVLVGRDKARLSALADQLDDCAAVLAVETFHDMVETIARRRPGVLLNTVGPFAKTALPIIRACPPGTHYVDLSNELPAVQAVLALHEQAVAKSSTYVAGAGFGVLATESIVLALCRDRPPAAAVRTAAIPAMRSEAGRLGEALAASIIDGLAHGGRHYGDGRLINTALMGAFEQLSLPDGRTLGTASAPTGELEAARRASGAACVVATTSMVPTTFATRAALRAVLPILKIGLVRRFFVRQLAAINVKASAPKSVASWSYARVGWSSGETEEGWLRAGDAMDFTSSVMTEVAIRLAGHGGPFGSYTPGALFGPDLARKCGGEFQMPPPSKTDLHASNGKASAGESRTSSIF